MDTNFPFPMAPSRSSHRELAVHLREDGYRASAELVTRLAAQDWWNHIACCASHGDLWIAAIGASRAALVVRYLGAPKDEPRNDAPFEIVRPPRLEGRHVRLDGAVELISTAAEELGLAARRTE